MSHPSVYSNRETFYQFKFPTDVVKIISDYCYCPETLQVLSTFDNLNVLRDIVNIIDEYCIVPPIPPRRFFLLCPRRWAKSY